MPRAAIDGDRVRITGLRNFEYRSRNDFTERHEEREVWLSHLTALDFYVSYWAEGLVGHTFVSFIFDNAPPLSISIETRPEVGEGFAPIASLFKQFELIYVVGDERDLVGVRTNHRNEAVYLYRLNTSADDARRLLLVYGAGGLVVPFDETATERPSGARTRHDDVRSIAYLKMLQSLSGKLSRLNDITQIGLTIADELRLLIDYHNCRVFVREGEDLLPLAFRGDLTAADPGAPATLLPAAVGRGVTGRVAETGVPLLIGDAAQCEFGERIEGTAEIEESLLAVPFKFGSRVNGVIVISKLGLDQFDADDLRVLEVLAGHASVALENARLYDAQRREAESANALLEFGRQIAGTEEIAEIAQRVVRGSGAILSSPLTSLWLQDAETGDLVMLASSPPRDPETSLGAVPSAHLEPWLERTEPFSISAEDYAAIASPPLDTDGHFAIAPFAVEGRWGVIAAATAADEGHGERELQLLGGLARQTKLALQNALNYERLERTFLSTVEALANALEASDANVSSHARWITDLALRVGEELGLEARALKRLELGALFHDIGKIGIPAAILAKPGPLTDEEWDVVETHPVLGERILAPIEQLTEVGKIVRGCHERFDGTGYPDELARDDIPLESRIVFACDAYHALTTDRPYRQALGAAEARRRLTEASGSQFDPQVVDALLRVVDR
jgi:HD-GYP domain-containing protein (c-di-GMP phosphodiesterase class II)